MIQRRHSPGRSGRRVAGTLTDSLTRVCNGRIVVLETGRELSFSFEEMLDFHAGNSPGGVAHAFKVLERGLPLLDPAGRVERGEIFIATAFGGPGARDGFELVTGAVTGERFILDQSLSRPEYGRARERFVFRLRYRDRMSTLALREGFVTDEFIDLARQEARTSEEERHLDRLKAEMATRVMSAPALAVYDAWTE